MTVVLGMILAWTFTSTPAALLAPVPLAGLFWRVASTGPRAAFTLGVTFGLGFFGALLVWLPVSLMTLFGPFGALLVVPLVLLLALSWGAAASVTRQLAGPATVWALPFTWVLLEWLRGLGPFAFTWGTLGYAWVGTPFVQVADLGGVLLVSLLVALTASALAAGQKALGPRALLLAVLALAWAYGSRAVPPAERPYHALLVQGAVNPRAKLTRRTSEELDLYARLTRRGLQSGKVDLVVWPETASPLPPSIPTVRRTLRDLGVPLLFGAATPDGQTFSNSVYAFAGSDITGRQDKVKLVPFGEYFPWRRPLALVYEKVFAALHLPALQGVVAGDKAAPLTLNLFRVGVSICYESTFPELARSLVRQGANVLVTVSNDAWFGHTRGAEQHFQMGRLRAIETRRFWLRVGNDGVSAVVDPQGRVTARFPRGMQAPFTAAFDVMQGQTWFVRLGNWPVALSALALLVLMWRSRNESHRVSNR